MLRCAVLFLAAGLASAQPNGPPIRPKWPPVYTVEGVMTITLSGIQEPFKWWFDSTDARSSRFDIGFNGTLKHFNLRNDGYYAIYPRTTETELNPWFCDFYRKEDIHAIPPLPDLEDYQPIGSKTIFGVEAWEWQIKKVSFNMRYTYTVRVLHLNPGDNVSFIPLSFEIKYEDIKKGFVADRVYTEYTNYKAGPIPKEFFDPAIAVYNGSRPIPPLACRSINPYQALNPLEQYLYPYHNKHEEEFKQFKEKYGWKYLSHEEHEDRFNIFQRNLRFINLHNRAGRGYRLAVNHLADRTPAELEMLLGLPRPGEQENNQPAPSGLPFPYSEEEIKELSAKLPEQHDWRLYGAVTPVKNQERCRTAWVFSAVGAVESALFLHSQDLVRLSEQAVMDCSWGFGSSGCAGGFVAGAFAWITAHGLPLDDAYGGYLMHDGFCHIKNVTKVADVESYVSIPAGNKDALKLAIFQSGPVSVSIDASAISFVFYSHGIYDEPSCNPKKLNHAVLAVGFGVQNNQSYWLIKNSWGPYWGSEGYMLISTKNGCGIENLAAYPKIKK